ncbi:MAG: hypothetical protein NZ703_06125, partial [Gemmataceae bacterium]|nr:hypothetical protein [Gemmataceae bacterium]
QIASWVAALSKDTRLPEAEREARYCQQLQNADWQVQLLKLADMYDNLCDAHRLEPARRLPVLAKIRRYVEVLRPVAATSPATREAFRHVEQALVQFEQSN